MSPRIVNGEGYPGKSRELKNVTTGGDGGDNPSTRGASERSLIKVESGINGLLPAYGGPLPFIPFLA
jgi:hypothetical protein